MHPELGLIVESDLNTGNLADLLEVATAGTGIVPFVGAGLSKPFGFPEWGEFLRRQGRQAGIGEQIEAQLAGGEYEEAAEALQTELGDLAFEDAIRRTYGTQSIPANRAAAVGVLPALAAGPVLTTNFDTVLESVFESAGSRFEDVVWAAQQPGTVTTAVHTNKHLLWKLHGGFKAEHYRVLTRSEYVDQYGDSDPGKADWQRPLPQMLASLLAGRVLLFLGSSLDKDRTVRILEAFRRGHRGAGHYAVMEHPGDEPLRRTRARALSNVAVRPIWFPKGRFDLIGPFLTFLSDATRQQAEARARRYASVRHEVEAQQQAHASAGVGAPNLQPQRIVGRRPAVTQTLRGRDGELREVARRLAEPSRRIISIYGPSGIGKTALAVNVLTSVEAGRWPDGIPALPVDGIAFIQARAAGATVERLFFACARMLGNEARVDLERTWKKEGLDLAQRLDRMLEATHRGVYVVLVHHADDLLDADGTITDQEFLALVGRMLQTPCGLRLVLASRTRPGLPQQAPQVEPPMRVDKGLSTAAGVAMLRDLDEKVSSGLATVSDAVLARVPERLFGVPRALEVFAGILASDEYLTVDSLLERFYGREDVVADVFKAGLTRLDAPSLRVVEALAVLGEPVPPAAVEMVLQPFEPNLDLMAILRRLTRSQIVRIVDREKGTCALHPIDEEFAYAQCPAEGAYSRKTLHYRAAEWYASVRPPRETWRTLEAVVPVLLEFAHRVKAGSYDDAAAVLAAFDDEFGARLGYGARSLAMHLQLQGRLTNDRLRLANVLGLAHAYRRVGPLDKAVDGYRESLTLARQQQNTAAEIESLGWMGEVFRRLGRLDEGKPVVREAVEVARQSGDQVAVARWLGELGLTCCYLGELDEALEHAEEAYEVAVSVQEVNWKALAIDCLSLVHLARGEPLEAIEVGNRAINSYKDGTWAHTVIYVLNVQGLAHLDLGQVDSAIDCLKRAYDEARTIEDIRVEGMAQFNLAHAYRLKPDMDEALACAERAVRSLARTGGGELPAARALLDALTARAAGIRAAEARALVALARASYTNPDLRHPRGVLSDAIDLARKSHLAPVVEEAEQLQALIRVRESGAKAVG